MDRKKSTILLMVLIGLFPLIAGRVTSLLIVSVFVLVWLLAPYLHKLPKLWLPLWARYTGVGLLFSILTEYFVFKEHFEVFHSNIAMDIFLALGIYGSLMLIWYFLLKRFQFTLVQMFTMAGVWGVVFEQNGRVLLSLNLLGYLFIFLVYGSVMCIPFVFYRHEFEEFSRQSSKSRYWKTFLAQCLGYVGGFLWIAFFKTIWHLK